jgi:uncharacterized iron-regulated protein
MFHWERQITIAKARAKRMSNRWFHYVLLAATLLFLSACQALDAKRQYSTPLDAHPLLDQIWDVRSQRPVTRDTLLQRAAKARYVLLGETHDNADHHRIQSDVLKSLITKGARPTLAMEQFDVENQTAIDNLLATPITTTNAIAEAGQFNRKGWNWSFYEPMVAIALQAKLPITAINLSRSAARRIVNEGLEVFGEQRMAELALDNTWDQKREEVLRRAIIEGHCGSVPEDLLPKLVTAQRARDATMADVLVSRAGNSVVAILGREHARRDIGVPVYLTKRVPVDPMISVALIEIEPRHNRVSDYIPLEGEPRFDFIWFTSRAQREDLCASLPLPAS